MPATKPIRERFESKYIGEPNSGCWLWTAAITEGNGYGRIGRGVPHGKGTITAHRLSWELHRGPIPEGLWVLHKCDTRACVNPDHLFLGTVADNYDDSRAKDRDGRGERAHHAKLTAQQVIEIRKSGELRDRLASRFGVSGQTINDIRARRSWKHL